MWQLFAFNLNEIYLLFINFNWFKEEKKSILEMGKEMLIRISFRNGEDPDAFL